MGRIIVIDGTSNAGKTTLCENIERNIKNVVIVPGASLLLKYIKRNILVFQQFLKTYKKKKENQKFFLDLN